MGVDIADLLKEKAPQRHTVHILMDPSLEETRKVLLRKLSKAVRYDETHNERDTAPEVEAEIVEVEKRIAESRVPFTFESIGRKAYSALLDEYKPRPGDETDKEVGFNLDEFPPRLIALSSQEPKIDLDQARKIWDEWSDAETTLLLGGAIIANKEVVDVPFTNDGSPMGIRNTVKPSPTVSTEGSPTPSS